MFLRENLDKTHHWWSMSRLLLYKYCCIDQSNSSRSIHRLNLLLMIDVTTGTTHIPRLHQSNVPSWKPQRNSSLMIDITAAIVQILLYWSTQLFSVKTSTKPIIDDRCHVWHHAHTPVFIRVMFRRENSYETHKWWSIWPLALFT